MDDVKAGGQMEALRACGVWHGYGRGSARAEVLRGFSLEMQRGEFVALMGPSGSGKSTFLHLTAGLILPEKGSIFVDGREVTAMDDSAAAKFRRRHLGIVFQSFNLVESLTAARNIVLGATLDRAAVSRERLHALASRLGIEKALEKMPSELSGGERQRVAIARALYRKPALILADEPTGNLDQKNARELCALLGELNKEEGAAILLVTHDPVVAASASRVCFLKDGAIASTMPTANDPSAIARICMQQEF